MSQPDWPSLATANLLDLLDDKDAFIRRAALGELCRRGPSQDAQQALLAAFTDSSGYVKRTAADIATGWQYAAAHDRLVDLLTDPEDHTRIEALRAMCTLGVEADIPVLTALYDRDTALEARRMAAWALQVVAGPTTWAPIFERFTRDTETDRHRVWAAEIAGRFGDAACLPALALLAADADGHVRGAAERAAETIRARV